MGDKLRLEYENADQAIRTLLETKEEYEAAQLGLRSQVGSLGKQFQGHSAQKFLSWWNGTGDKHWGTIVEHVNSLYGILDTIERMIVSADEQCAARFKYDVQIEQPGG